MNQLRKSRKILALLLSLSLCAGMTPLTGAAEETASAEVTETAEDTGESETSEGEEGSRSEAVEEIEITAAQVEKHMQKLGSAEGYTFYVRPEDYKDSIPDEDVVSLLKHIELAGIDDKSGKVACTLEEEEHTKEEKIFLSEEGRWLVRTDSDIKKVTAVRQIVSTLDNPCLFISPDHKTLELFNEDYDELLRTYTGGKVQDGAAVFTAEENWQVKLSETCDSVISMGRRVAENDLLELWLNDEEAVIGLYDKKAKKMWWSTPERIGHDRIATNTIVDQLSSSLTMVYGEPSARSTTNMRSKSDATLKVKVSGDTIRVEYKFKKAGITVPVEYKLLDNALEASIDTASIEEDKEAESPKIVTKLSMLGAFGAAGMEDEGCFVVPDGCGALINFNNGKVDAKAYTGYVYGADLTAVPITAPAVTQPVCFPMFGIVNGDNALMAVCTDGDANAVIEASTSRLSKSSYNICGFNFTVRDTDSYYMSGDNTNSLTVFESGEIKSDRLAVRYYPVQVQGEADYSDIAAAYRDYLTGEYGVEKTAEAADPALYVDLYGGVEKEKSVLGIPVRMKTVLTDYDQAKSILQGLSEDGVQQMTVQYHNWTNDGIEGKIDIKAKPSGKLGGAGAWRDLDSFATRSKVTIYPTVENATFVSGNGYHSFSDTAVRISGSYARVYAYDLAYGSQSSTEKPLSLLTPSAFTDLFTKTAQNYTNRKISALSVGSLTHALYGDYGKKKIGRDKAQELLTQSYRLVTDKNIRLLGETANAYALPYVQAVSHVPLSSSGYDLFDGDIPFYQLVLHGVKPMGSTAVNRAADPAQAVLYSVASGTDLCFDMIGAETSVLKDTALDTLFYAGAENWSDYAAGAYAFSRDVLTGLMDKNMTDFVQEDDTLTATYEDGTRVIVDLTDETATVGGSTYALRDYVDAEGGDNA